MSIKSILWASCFVFLMIFTPANGQTPPAPPMPEDVDQLPKGASVQMRGPVHEAFAQPYQAKPEPGFELPKPPPKPVEEVPPAVAPEDQGRGLTWIPGYWAWDGERYVWVSGMWRYPPPGTRWVPGHWAMTADGTHVWVPGFWAQSDQSHLQYLPPPPEPQEYDPSTEPPYENAYWVPGCWQYQQQRYAWRRGFWARGRADWVWCPARYLWTPRGCVFVDGYWDYGPERRGTLFAPVYFAHGFHGRYRPSVLLNAGSLFVHLFAQPRYHRYCFGNYYGIGGRGGLHPWLTYRSRGRYYDPLLAYYGAVRTKDLAQIRARHDYFTANAALRPPVQWSDHARYNKGLAAKSPAAAPIAVQAGQALRDSKSWNVQRFDAKKIASHASSAQFYNKVAALRSQFEANGKNGFQSRTARDFKSPKATPFKSGPSAAFQPGKTGKGNVAPAVKSQQPKAPTTGKKTPSVRPGKSSFNPPNKQKPPAVPNKGNKPGSFRPGKGNSSFNTPPQFQKPAAPKTVNKGAYVRPGTPPKYQKPVAPKPSNRPTYLQPGTSGKGPYNSPPKYQRPATPSPSKKYTPPAKTYRPAAPSPPKKSYQVPSRKSTNTNRPPSPTYRSRPPTPRYVPQTNRNPSRSQFPSGGRSNSGGKGKR